MRHAALHVYALKAKHIRHFSQIHGLTIALLHPLLDCGAVPGTFLD